jgi:hypothetical protein
MANSDNPARGAAFEQAVGAFFQRHSRLKLTPNFVVQVGVASKRRPRKFDLGSTKPRVLVECKRHTWTKGGNAPSAKLTCWNEAMYFFSTAPASYRRILAVCKSLRKGQSLAEHYVGRFDHLVPRNVEIWEIDPDSGTGRRVFRGS